jgi:hypothetical protein
MFSTLLFLGSGETKGVSAAPTGQYPVDHVVFSNTGLRLYTTGQWAPYVRPQDSFMLIQNNTFGFADQNSVDNLNSWARQLKNKYPGQPLYAATSGPKNMRFIAPRLDKGLFEGIMYVYELCIRAKSGKRTRVHLEW